MVFNILSIVLNKQTRVINHINKQQLISLCSPYSFPRYPLQSHTKQSLVSKMMHYFKYQHKIQMLPYIELQVQQYLTYLDGQISNNCLNLAETLKVSRILDRKLKKIEEFYQKWYVDFRGPLINRTLILIKKFMDKHALFFQEAKDRHQQSIKKETKVQKTPTRQESDKIKQFKQKLSARSTSKQSNLISNTIGSSIQKSVSIEKSSKQKQKVPTKTSLQTPKQKIQRPSMRPIKTQQSESHEKEREIRQKRVTIGTYANRDKIVIKQKIKIEKKGEVKKMTKQQYIKYLKDKDKDKP